MRDPQRIAIFITNLTGGGAERIAANLAEGLAAQGYRIDIVMARAARKSYLPSSHPNIRQIDLGSKRIRGVLFKWVRYLRAENPDIVMSHLTEINIVGVIGRLISGRRPRHIVCEHSVISKSITRYRLMYKLALALLYRLADKVVAVSQYSRRDIIRFTGLPEHRVQCIYNPADFRKIAAECARPASHAWLREKDPEIPVILAAGRMVPVKNYALLLRAFALVNESRNARLVLLGDGPQRDALEMQARSLGISDKVAMPGFVDDPYACMRSADCFALSSYYEGLPTVLIEALACGCPIVATDCPGGVREIIRKPEYGTLVPVDDAHGMAQAILKCLEQKEQKQYDSQEALEPYEPQTTIQQYLDVMKEYEA